MRIRKIIPFILMLAAAGLALAACMNNDAGVQPAPTANYAPSGTGSAVQNDAAQNNAAQSGGAAGQTGNNSGAAGNTAAETNGALNPFDWLNGSAGVEKAIAQLSEVSEARVVVTNSTALVGVKFDNAYKGEMTERIREMVAAEVLRVDPSIQTVAVTADPEDVAKVYDLSERIRAGRTADELSAEINAIVRNATTLR